MSSTKPTIIEEEEVPMYKVKDELAKIKKRETELNFRVQKTEEYINSFTILKTKDANELIEKIKALNITRLSDKHIYKIVDILPVTVEELKVVMQGYPLSLNAENLKKIVNTINDVLPK